MKIVFSLFAGLGAALIMSHISLGVMFVVFGCGVTYVMLAFLVTSFFSYRMLRG